MNIVHGAVRVVTATANVTTAGAGAIGGAAVNGVIGAVEGTVAGVRSGLSSGSHSTPAAALTLGVVGAAGLADWPVLLAVGGTALLVRRLSHQSNGQRSAPAEQASSTDSTARVTPVKSTTRAATTAARKTTRARRTPTKRS